MNVNGLMEYVKTLSPTMRNIFKLADDVVKESSDTLSKEFQLATAIFGVFVEKAEEQLITIPPG